MTEQLSLPYIEIKSVMGRTGLRKEFRNSSRESYFIPFNKIQERPGFNQRKVYDGIEELAESIFIHGLKEPFVLDILPDGIAYIEEGHRRQRAIALLVSQGKVTVETEYEFFPNKSKVTELDRMINQFTSNNHKKKLKPFEIAAVALCVKNNFSVKPKSHEEISKLMGVSRQQVDNYIKIATADDLLKNQMLMADMNMKDCLALIGSKKQGEKATDKIEEDSHKTSSTIPGKKDELAGEISELNKLEKDDDLPFIEETDEERIKRDEREAEEELKELLKISDEVKVPKLKHHIGKKLSAHIKETEDEQFVDESTGETITKEVTKFFLNKGTVLTDDIIKEIQDNGVKTVYVYKQGCEPVAPSVITEQVAIKEKDKYDSNRQEIADIQNVIGLADRISVRIEKLDISTGDKKDITDWCKWLLESAMKARDYIHANKKENKR